VSKVVVQKNISFDDHKNCVLNDTPKRVKLNAIRTLKLTNHSLTQDKLALSNKDDKRVWFDKTSSRAKILFPNGELNLLSPGSGCPLQAGTGHGRPGRAPGRC
jgi:hypothetical protein